MKDLCKKFSKLQRLLHRIHLQSHAECSPLANPLRGQGRVLAILKLQPEICTKDLSYLLGIRQQSLNELLNKLEKNGYVTRTPSDKDKRVMLVSLTEKGKNEQQLDSDFGDVLFCLNDEEQSNLNEYLDRIIGSLKNQLSDESNLDDLDWAHAAHHRTKDEFLYQAHSHHDGFTHRHKHSHCEKRHQNPEHCRHDSDSGDSFPRRHERQQCRGHNSCNTPPENTHTTN